MGPSWNQENLSYLANIPQLNKDVQGTDVLRPSEQKSHLTGVLLYRKSNDSFKSCKKYYFYITINLIRCKSTFGNK